MSRNKTVPVSIRVARWAAVAAVITAVGSVFDTMWSTRPWWVDSQPTPMVSVESAPVEKPVHISSIKTFNRTIDNQANIPPEEESNSAPASTAMFSMGEEPIHVSKWLLFGSIFVGAVYGVIEFFHYRKKKNQATLSDK